MLWDHESFENTSFGPENTVSRQLKTRAQQERTKEVNKISGTRWKFWGVTSADFSKQKNKQVWYSQKIIWKLTNLIYNFWNVGSCWSASLSQKE